MNDHGRQPPLSRLAARILRRGPSRAAAEFVLGDLHEEYRRLRARGFVRAALWYWTQVLSARFSPPDRLLLDLPAHEKPTMFERTLRDVNGAFRTMRKNPVSSAFVVLTLGAGIAATTLIFSIVNAVSLQALPYPDADRLVVIRETLDNDPARAVPTSYPTFLDWAEADAFTQSAALSPLNTVVLVGEDETLRLRANLVTSSYFAITGLQPQLGSVYGPEADSASSVATVAVISHGLWERRFGSRSDVVGSTIELSGNSYTIVGVAPESHIDLYSGGAPTDVWLPVTALNQMATPGSLERRVVRQFQGLARLTEGATVEAAQQEITGIAGSIQESFPDVMGTQGAVVITLRQQLVGGLSTPLNTLLIGSGFLLLMGCINVSSLMLFRGTSRAREIAIRQAMGASRIRLIRLLVTESVLLAAIGGGLGILLAAAGINGLVSSSIIPLPSFATVQLDPFVLATSALVIAGTGMLVGLLPAFRNTKADIGRVLTETDTRSAGRSSRRSASVLVVAEITVAVVLVVGSGLVVRSFQHLNGVDLGFRTDSIMSAQVELPRRAYPTEDLVFDFRRRLVEELSARPEIDFALTWGPGLPGQAASYTTAVPEGKVVESQLEADLTRMHGVTPGAVKEMGISLLSGRLLDAADSAGTQRVAVISETLAATLWPEDDALGKTFNHVIPADRDPADYPPYEVIGIVTDASLGGRLIGTFGVPDLNDMYVPIEQLYMRNNITAFSVLAGTSGNPGAATDAIRNAVRSVDPNVAMFNPQDLETVATTELVFAQFVAVLMATFSSLSLLLAAIGIYGVLAQSVASRTREIGVRKALGAESRSTAWLVVGQATRLAAIGVVLGLGLATAMAQSISSILFGVAPSDPLTLAGSTTLIGAVVLAASYVPARRALRVDPVDSLRAD